MRYSLRTLLIMVAIVPPLIASLWFNFAICVAIGCYVATIASIVPAAIYLWRNGPPRG